MTSFYRNCAAIAVLIAMTATGRHACAQVGGVKAKVYRLISEPMLERLLNNMNYNFRKNNSTTGTSEHIYVVTTSDNNNMNLLVVKMGKALWAVGILPEISTNALNDWNKRAATSRAWRSVDRKTGKVNSVVEWQLDAGGGVTEPLIRQFIIELRRVVDSFAQHVKDNQKSKS